MIWRVEIKDKQGIFDAAGAAVEKDIHDLGIHSISKVDVIQVFHLAGSLSESQIQKICRELLVDRVVQDYIYSSEPIVPTGNPQDLHVVEIAYNPGVMDPVEESTLKGIRDLGIGGMEFVRTAKKYLLHGRLNSRELDILVNKVLSNKLIQHVVDPAHSQPKAPAASGTQKFELVMIPLREEKERDLARLSREGQLFLNLTEMKAIQKYFRDIGRDPTDCELETIAQTWSEHCHHKTFRGNIQFTYFEKGKKKTRLIKNLLKSTIVKATEKINKSWCVSVFHDNAGVIKFDQESNVCFKVETHNHPSALEPFGGANTGVGGVIRDSLGTGLGARPICNTDVFCFAPPDYPFDRLPAGTLHPKRVMKGVVSGVRDYGNKMGIPTVNGAILFDERFVGNPLVFCGNVGLIPKDKVKKSVGTGDLVVVMGGRTGRDGIHGATFSSGDLTHESEVVSSGAVQIGDPIQEKKVLDILMQARDRGLYSAITDCGAGGLSSAVGEMGEKTGARVDLEKVPLKYQGLKYTEIWISESQERMVLAVPPTKIDQLLELCRGENVEASVIGEFNGSKRLELFYQGCQVCDLDMSFLHEGIPKITKEAVWKPAKHKEPRLTNPKDLTESIFRSLSHFNVCSKEWVVRQYDHEVQGSSVIKPFVGVECDGPSDASVLRPKLDSNKGIAIANGINPRFGMIDPFWMAASCIDEAVRQIISVGGRLDSIAILDNFCWGNPDKSDRLGGLVRAAEGCYKAALAYRVPFISGKDSLYNEYVERGKSLAIPGTLLISAIGILDNVEKAVTMDFKHPGNLIYVIGETHEELGGSIYYDLHGAVGNSVPIINPSRAIKTFLAVSQAVQKGWLKAIHDCSEGGLAVALAEMAFSGGWGITVRLDQVPYAGRNKRNDFVLFSESNSRFVVEVAPEHQKNFEKLFKGIPHGLIGRTEEGPEFVVYGLNKKVCASAYIHDLKHSWQLPLKFS